MMWRPTVSFEDVAFISLDESDWLERNFEEEEIMLLSRLVYLTRL